MRRLTWTAMVAVALLWAPAWADDQEAAARDDTGAAVVVRATEGGDGEAKVRIKVVTERKDAEVEGDAKAAPKAAPRAGIAVRIAPEAAQVVPARAWLGVSVTPVPAALRAHLSIGEGGVMVRNLVVDSPADKAGLDRYDVITAVDDKDVDSPAGLVRLIGDRDPGDEVTLKVVHKGRAGRVKVTLGKPAAGESLRHKYELEPDEVLRDRLKLHGGVIRRGPHGWVLPPGMEELEGGLNLRELLRKFPTEGLSDLEVQLRSDSDESTFRIVESRDGRKISIERHKDGRITVAKEVATESGGRQTVTKTYKDAGELRREDPEAYKVYSRAKVRISAPRGRGGLVVPKAPDHEEALKAWVRASEMLSEGVGGLAGVEAEAGVKREFHVAEDGRIEVRVRKGADEMTLQFRSDQEFKKAQPKLYEHYRRMLEAGK